jgi:hypothetical protein
MMIDSSLKYKGQGTRDSEVCESLYLDVRLVVVTDFWVSEEVVILSTVHVIARIPRRLHVAALSAILWQVHQRQQQSHSVLPCFRHREVQRL